MRVARMPARSTLPPRHAIVISQQQMYRVGNQVLYRTIEGYLNGGFSISLILPVSDDSELADVATLFPETEDRLRIIRVKPLASAAARALKKLRREPATLRSTGAAFADPRVTLPFHPEGRILTAFTLAAFTASAVIAALREWRRHPADVMVGFELLGVPAAVLVARRFGVPVVGHYQGTFLGEALGRSRSYMLRRYPADYLGTAAPLDLYFMLNDGTRGDEVLAALGVARERVRFRMSGVRQDVYAEHSDRKAFLSSRGIPEMPDTTILVSLSKLGGWKRIERILFSMPQVLAASPATRLLIAHRGPMREALEELAHRLAVSSNVHFIGPMSHTDIRQLLGTCDVFLSVNDHSNLSNPLLEAMTAACAIVTLDDGSTRGLLEHGVNALLADPKRLPGSLSDAIIELLRDPARRRRLAARARETAREQLTSWPERIALEVAEVRDLVERRIAARAKAE